MNLPNVLTILRIFLVPILVVVILTKFDGKEVVALAIFWIAAFTDALDGYLARRNQQITNLGKLLDPIADKILVSAAFISLVEIGAVKSWLVAVIVAREFAVDGLRMMAANQRLVISASRLGKLKMASQTLTISVVLLGVRYLGHFVFVGHVLLWITMAISVLSGVDYFVRFWKVLSESPQDDGAPPEEPPSS